MTAPKHSREDAILHDGLALLVRECAPQRIYLFGSRAKGVHVPQSDFDFAIEGARISSDKRNRVRSLLDAIAGLYSVNLVFLEETDPQFQQIVRESGKILYEHP